MLLKPLVFLSPLLQKLRSAFVSAVWSKKMPLAHVGAVLTLMNGHPGCDPGFFIICCRFRLLRRYLTYRPMEAPRIYHLLGLVAAGGPGSGPMHLLVDNANTLGFTWDPLNSGWVIPACPCFISWLGLIYISRLLFGRLGRQRSALTFAEGRDSGGGPMLDIAGSLQLLHAPHVRERDKALLRSIMVGGVWNGFLLGHARGEIVPCRLCGGFDGERHLFLGMSSLPSGANT